MNVSSSYNTIVIREAEEIGIVKKTNKQDALWQSENNDRCYNTKSKLRSYYQVHNQCKSAMKGNNDANNHEAEEESCSWESEEQQEQLLSITFASEGYDEVNLIPEIQPVRRTSYNARSILRHGHYYNRELIELCNGQYWEPYHSVFTIPLSNDMHNNMCQQSTKLSSNCSNNYNMKIQKQKRSDSTRQQHHEKSKNAKQHRSNSRDVMQQNKSNALNVFHHSREEKDNLCVICLHYTDNTHVKVRHMPLQSWQAIRDCSEVIACTPHRLGVSSQHLILPSSHSTSSITSSPFTSSSSPSSSLFTLSVAKNAYMSLETNAEMSTLPLFQPFHNSVLPEAMQRCRHEQRNVPHITSYEEVKQSGMTNVTCKCNEFTNNQLVKKCANNENSASSNLIESKDNVNTITLYNCNMEEELSEQQKQSLNHTTTEDENIHLHSTSNINSMSADQVTITNNNNNISNANENDEVNTCSIENSESNNAKCVNERGNSANEQISENKNINCINSSNITESEEGSSENRECGNISVLNNNNRISYTNTNNTNNNDEPNVFDYFTMPPSRIAAIHKWKHASFGHYMQHKMLYNNYILRCIEREDRRAFLANERREVFLRCLQRDVQHRLDNDELYVVGREFPEELVQMFFILNDFGAIESLRRRHHHNHHHHHHYQIHHRENNNNRNSRRNFDNLEQQEEENDNSQQQEEQLEEEEGEVAHSENCEEDQMLAQVNTETIVNTGDSNDVNNSGNNSVNDNHRTENNTMAPIHHNQAERQGVRTNRARRVRGQREELRNDNNNNNNNNINNNRSSSSSFFSLDISNARWEDNLFFPGQRPVNGYVIVTASPAGIAEDEVGIDEPIDYGTAEYIPRTKSDTNDSIMNDENTSNSNESKNNVDGNTGSTTEEEENKMTVHTANTSQNGSDKATMSVKGI